MLLGNFQAAKRHMSMLRHLLKDDNSLESLGYQGKLKHLFLQLEYFFTLNNGEEPLVKRIPYESKYPCLPLDDEMSKLVNTLPSGFQKLARSGRLSSQVIQLLGRAQEMVAAVANGTAAVWLAKPNENPYSNYREALPCLDATDGEKQHLEKLICYAIFLLTSRLLSPVKTAIWSLPTSGGRAQITQQALNCRADTNAEKHCLIWLWLMCIDAWGIVSGTMPVRGQILMQQLKAR